MIARVEKGYVLGWNKSIGLTYIHSSKLTYNLHSHQVHSEAFGRVLHCVYKLPSTGGDLPATVYQSISRLSTNKLSQSLISQCKMESTVEDHNISSIKIISERIGPWFYHKGGEASYYMHDE